LDAGAGFGTRLLAPMPGLIAGMGVKGWQAVETLLIILVLLFLLGGGGFYWRRRGR
jgi:hypothetical protein